MIDYTELFRPQSVAYFEENPDALYMKVFYMIRDMVDDEGERQWMGSSTVTILSMDYSRADGISPSDANILDQYTRRPDLDASVTALPNFVTPEYQLRFPPRR